MRALTVLATILALCAIAASAFFIQRELETEQRVVEVQQIGSPCRSALQDELERRLESERNPADYWEAVFKALHHPECAEQSDVVHWSYCIRHEIAGGSCATLPKPLARRIQPDREGGGADNPQPQGSGQPAPGPAGSGAVDQPADEPEPSAPAPPRGGEPPSGSSGAPSGGNSATANPPQQPAPPEPGLVCELTSELVPPLLDGIEPLLCPDP